MVQPKLEAIISTKFKLEERRKLISGMVYGWWFWPTAQRSYFKVTHDVNMLRSDILN